MQESTFQKMQKVLELAVKINPTSTEKEKTHNKPTVFVAFSGHVSKFEVLVYNKGWCEVSRADKNWQIYFEYDSDQKIDTTLNDILNTLEELEKRWCKNG